MSKALLKSELEKEFQKLETKRSSKGKVNNKGSVSDLLPTKRHGIKKELKRLTSERKPTSKLPKNNLCYKGMCANGKAIHVLQNEENKI